MIARNSLARLPRVALLVATLAPALVSARVRVTPGHRDVDLEPMRARGSYVRICTVEGASRELVVRALRGPATGPLGFAPRFQSTTPVRDQYDGRRVQAQGMRIPGAPVALGSTVTGYVSDRGMEARMTEGLVGGDFRIEVGPEERGPSGPRVRVTETGAFHVMRRPPKTVFGIPAFMFANFTPMGWLGQALGGAAVSKGHIDFFDLEGALEKRLNSGLPQYAD